MRKVVICTPAHNGATDVLYTYALAETVRLGMQNGIAFLPLFLPGESLLSIARNELFALAYQTDCTDTIWIDSDMGWDPVWCLKLLAHDVDVVSGTARRKSEIETYVCKCPPERLVVGPNGLIEVEGIGLAFTRLSRKAMDVLWNTAELYRTGDGQARRWIFNVQPIEGRVMSEDIAMCAQFRAHGIVPYLDPTMTADHVGRHVFKGDFVKWMAEFKAASAIETRQPLSEVAKLPTLH